MPILNKAGYILPTKLVDLVDGYNKEGASDLEKLFYLKNICSFLKDQAIPELLHGAVN